MREHQNVNCQKHPCPREFALCLSFLAEELCSEIKHTNVLDVAKDVYLASFWRSIRSVDALVFG